MAKSINQIIQEVDALIDGHSKTAAAKPTPAIDDDFIGKLAEEVLKEDNTKVAENDSDIVTMTEKIAHAAAIMDTVINLDQLQKLATFEAKMLEAGKSPEEIGSFLEKKGSVRLKSVMDLLEG